MTDNVVTTTEDTTGATGGETTPATVVDTTIVAAAPADVLERPADLPESFWDDAAKAPKYSDIAARLTRADELETAETARKEGVPEKVDDYKFEMSGDPILGPDGQPAAIDPANPLTTAVAAVAHKHGLPQGVVSDFVRAYVETEVAGEKALKEALDAEAGKLGEKAKERVTAVQAAIKANCGEHADAAIAALGTAGAVQAWEAMIAKLTGAAMTTPQGADQKAKSTAETWFPSMTSTKAA